MIVMSGPLPPAVGGMASVLAALQGSSLAQRVQLQLFETGKVTPPGRRLWEGVATRLRLMHRWWQLFGRRPAPVAHIHTCSGLTFFLDGLLLMLSRARGAPVVLHVHGARFDEFLDGLSAPALAFSRWLARRADVVVVLSPEWRERLAARWPGARLAVVANGVSMPAMAATVAEPGPARFVFLGNLGHRKGVHLIVQAAALAREPWHLSLAGGEEEPGFTGWTRAEIDRLGLAGRLSVLGPVVGPAKLALLANAQALVLPSLAEGLPMALLEGMAMALPAVVSSVGAMPEVVRDGVDGFVIPADDAPALAAALDRLSTMPVERQRLGLSAAERCRALYGVERMVDALMGVYASLPRRPS